MKLTFNRKINTFNLFLALLCSNTCLCQFSKAIDQNSNANIVHINNNNEILHGVSGVNLNRVVTKFDISGNIIWSKEFQPFDIDGISHKVSMGLTTRFNDNGDFLFTSVLRPFELRKITFSRLNSIGKVNLTKLIEYPINFIPKFQGDGLKRPKSLEFNSGNYIQLNYLSDTEENNYFYSFVKFNNQGELLWHKEYKDLLTGTPIAFINKLDGNRFALIRNGGYEVNNEEPHIENIIQILDENFTELKTIQIDGEIQKIIYRNDYYYILVYEYGFKNSDSRFNNSLICLNNEFEPIWAKEYVLTPISAPFTFSETDFGFLMSEYLEGFTKINLIALNMDGDIIKSKIIATPRFSYAPSVSNRFFVHDGIHFFNSTQPQQLTCSANNLDSLPCYALNSCIDVVNFNAEVSIIDTFYLEPINLDIEVKDVFIETVDYEPNYYDYCNVDYVDCPIPLFDIRDTICVNELITVSNLHNENAESVNWFLPGSNIEFSNSADPPPFSYPDPGTYTITQQTTDEGCPNEFSQEIVVVAPIELGVETDIILCNEEPFIIDAENNLVTDYLWDNGDTVSTLLTNQEGTYRLQLTDEYCSQSIDFNISYFDFDRIDPSFLTDTVICSQKPLLLGTILEEDVKYFWSDGKQTYPKQIAESGLYTLTTSLDGCSTTSSTLIKAEDCSTKIYMPNVFSPNKDGINDSIYPLGNNLEILNFAVYDKWGNEVHQSLTPWNGSYRNKESSSGVYAYTLEVKNTRLDLIEKSSGTFMLMR